MSAESPLLNAFEVRVAGSPLDATKREALLDAVVEQSSELPDACNLRFSVSLFQSDGEALLEDGVFPEGAMTAIHVRTLEGDDHVLFEGEIVGVELDLTSVGPSTLTVRSLHPAHRLMRGNRQLTFLNQTDSDIFKKIVSAVGLQPRDLTRGGTVHPHTIQDNLSDWEFLQTLARRRGARVSCGQGKQVVFDGFSENAESVVVHWGEELLTFRPRTHAAGQVDEVEVRGWSLYEKSEIVATADDLHLGVPETGTNVQKAKRDFPRAKHVLTNQPVTSKREAQALADSTLRRLRGRFLQLESLCTGNPRLRPGRMLDVKNVGSRFNGKYPITSVVHTYSPGEGYLTQVASAGRDAEGLMPAVGTDKHAGMGQGGFTIGIVTDNKDPEGLGRVKVRYPSLESSSESHWCRIVSQMAGKGRGMFNLPENDDEVFVAFEQGDPGRPYVLGQLWNGKDRPPSLSGNSQHGPSSEVNRRGFYSRVGHKIDLDDTGGGGIKLTTAGGVKIHATDDGPTILCSTPGGQSITITDAGSLIKLEDNAGDTITMSNGTVNLNATTMMNLTAPMVNITGAVALTLNGLTITVTAGAMTAIQSGVLTSVASGDIVYIGAGGGLRAEAAGKAELQGKAGVEIEGTTVVQVTAAEVKLN